MNPFRRYSGRIAIVTTLWALSACGDDSAGPITPQTLAVTGGNQQSACFFQSLPDSLEVTLTGSDNRPFAGAPVGWQVTSGAATLSRAVDATDAAGRSRVQLSLGLAVTAVTVTATVSGLPPATLSAAGAFMPYALGQTATGALGPGDCFPSEHPFYYDLYVLTLPGSQSFTASLASAAFDASLHLGDTVWPVAENEDSADGSGGTNSFFRVIAAGGTYIFSASSFSAGETGAYTLATRASPVAADGCLFDVWVTRGVTTDQEIKTTDCVDASGPYYFDVYLIMLKAGQTITITESSTAFDAELFLCFDTCFASDDNSGGGTNARVTHQAPLGQNQQFLIVPATKAIGATGAYTLTIAPPATPPATLTPVLRAERAFEAVGRPKAGAALLRKWRRLGR